jgi:hypothetical protein
MAYHPLRGVPGTGVLGVVYLIHLDQPVGHAQHYTGWYQDPRRLEHHRQGTGAKLLAVAAQRGIGWRVVQEIPGDRNLERQLKNRGGARKRCPVCKEAS